MITQSRLKELLSYDSETGLLTWIINRKSVKIGFIAGTLCDTGYISVTLDMKRYKAHRLVWLYVHGEFPKECLDHINRDRADNRIDNLREVTNAENQQNKQFKSTGRLLGCHKLNKSEKFYSCIRFEGKNLRLGVFDTEEGAHQAYVSAKRKLHPFSTI